MVQTRFADSAVLPFQQPRIVLRKARPQALSEVSAGGNPLKRVEVSVFSCAMGLLSVNNQYLYIPKPQSPSLIISAPTLI